jgi:hypothetical protein
METKQMFKKVKEEAKDLTNESLIKILDKKIKDEEFDVKFYKEKLYQSQYMLSLLKKEKTKFDILNRVD